MLNVCVFFFNFSRKHDLFQRHFSNLKLQSSNWKPTRIYKHYRHWYFSFHLWSSDTLKWEDKHLRQWGFRSWYDVGNTKPLSHWGQPAYFEILTARCSPAYTLCWAGRKRWCEVLLFICRISKSLSLRLLEKAFFVCFNFICWLWTAALE